MQKVYCDTCVYMDAMGLNDNSHPYKDLNMFAWNFFNRVNEGSYILITSSWLFEEFKNVVGNDSQLNEFLHDLALENKIHIKESFEDRKEAKLLSKRNFPDARHAVLAKKANAMFITTQNFNDFAEFQHYLQKHSIQLTRPESL